MGIFIHTDFTSPSKFKCDFNVVLKQIYSNCKCIPIKTLKHRYEKDFTICIKCGTKEFIQKF